MNIEYFFIIFDHTSFVVKAEQKLFKSIFYVHSFILQAANNIFL